jgi:hypothetical protein
MNFEDISILFSMNDLRLSAARLKNPKVSRSSELIMRNDNVAGYYESIRLFTLTLRFLLLPA